MSSFHKTFDRKQIASILTEGIRETLEGVYGLTLTKDPDIQEKQIIEYNSRMRTMGMEKFEGPCYLSAITFYFTKKHLDEHDVIGAMIVYYNESTLVRLFKAFGFSDINEDDEDIIFDCCGEATNILAGQFKNKLAELGYKNLTISPPLKDRNDILQGVEFNYEEKKYYELSFDLWKKKALVVSVSMAPINR